MSNKSKDHEWTVDEEIALLRAVCKYRPIGIHKHFRIISVMQEMSYFTVRSAEIWKKLKTFYDLEQLDEISERFRNRGDFLKEEDGAFDVYFTEFLLPWEEYGEIMEEHRRASDSTSTSPPHLPYGAIGLGKVFEEIQEIETFQTEGLEPEITDDDSQLIVSSNKKKRPLVSRIMRRTNKQEKPNTPVSKKNNVLNTVASTRTLKFEKPLQNTPPNMRRSSRNKR
ncbi:hypothetical protein T552_00064 [Pneumocystis carinii B80]|uniref:Uncharacterized protein n=1 Tax=Pneumocystis carinii (strain B80) TaxID=1408658 RepID=A0A0W4ZSU1_PNEC8|nr:hypothetical protein T552_00064 [Pneumocystis carinii B80]KTW31420.1 hypothetical protein T552_00064 [Pneumocystis carinii B80]